MTTKSKVAAALQEVQEAAGDENIRESLVSTQWGEYLRQGVVVKVHVRRWRGTLTLTEADLGLPATTTLNPETADLINLGQKKLAPPTVLRAADAIEKQIRAAITDWSYPTPFGAFQPAEQYIETKALITALTGRLYAIRDSLVANYDIITEDMREMYRPVAEAAYEQLARGEDADTLPMKDAFVEDFCNRVVSHIPQASEIFESFKVTLDVSYVPLPSLLAEDIAKANEYQLQMQASRDAYGRQRELDNERHQTELAEERLRAANARTAEEERVRALREMHADALAQAQRNSQQIVAAFEQDMKANLYKRVEAILADTLAYIQKEGKLHGRKVKALQKTLRAAKNLNFFGDKDVDVAVRRIRDELTLRTSEKDVAGLEGLLSNLVVVLRDDLLSLGEQPQEARELTLPQATTTEEVDLIRHRLLEDDTLATLREQPALFVAAAMEDFERSI